jgi:predicted O-methyltransferase YrrM
MERAIQLIRWYLRARSAYRVHSPLLYAFCREVLDDRRRFHAFDQMDELRHHLLRDGRTIEQEDHGAGGERTSIRTRTVADVLRQSCSDPARGEFLFRTAMWWQPDLILEFGTALGISTAYLAAADSRRPVITVDASVGMLTIARENWQRLQLNGIEAIHGRFDEVWPQLPDLRGKRLLFYLDGDHRADRVSALLRAFAARADAPSIVLLDDIRWSADMYRGWQRHFDMPPEGAWIDLFQYGMWIRDPAFREPVAMSLLPRRWKPW